MNEKIEPIKVYARVNGNMEVIKILSSQFDEIAETDIFIDEGYGDDYVYPHLRFNIHGFDGKHNYMVNVKAKGSNRMVLIK